MAPQEISFGVGSEHSNIAVTKEDGETSRGIKYFLMFLGIPWDILGVYQSHTLGGSPPLLNCQLTSSFNIMAIYFWRRNYNQPGLINTVLG